MVPNTKHFEFEIDAWRRLLEFIQNENAHCKYRLAEVIKASNGDPAFLDQAEFYQNYYIQQDTHVSLLKNDLYSFGKLIEREKIEDGMIVKQVEGTHRRIKAEMHKLESEFSETKRRFGNFLDANA